jgi:hypothetical protein
MKKLKLLIAVLLTFSVNIALSYPTLADLKNASYQVTKKGLNMAFIAALTGKKILDSYKGLSSLSQKNDPLQISAKTDSEEYETQIKAQQEEKEGMLVSLRELGKINTILGGLSASFWLAKVAYRNTGFYELPLSLLGISLPILIDAYYLRDRYISEGTENILIGYLKKYFGETSLKSLRYQSQVKKNIRSINASMEWLRPFSQQMLTPSRCIASLGFIALCNLYGLHGYFLGMR